MRNPQPRRSSQSQPVRGRDEEQDEIVSADVEEVSRLGAVSKRLSLTAAVLQPHPSPWGRGQSAQTAVSARQVEVVEGVAGEEDHHDDQEEQGEENAEVEGQHDEHDEDGERRGPNYNSHKPLGLLTRRSKPATHEALAASEIAFYISMKSA